MRYDVYASKGGAERRIVLEDERQLAKGDTFAYEGEVYRVTGVAPGHDDFDGVVFADLVGQVGPGTNPTD